MEGNKDRMRLFYTKGANPANVRETWRRCNLIVRCFPNRQDAFIVKDPLGTGYMRDLFDESTIEMLRIREGIIAMPSWSLS
jgi:hypothetical protein